MIPIPTKFRVDNPQTREEKLIVDLIKDLDEVTSVFMKCNHSGDLTHEFFNILRDASIGYAGAMVRDLAKMLSIKDHKKILIQDAKNIYLSYIEDIEEELKCQK